MSLPSSLEIADTRLSTMFDRGDVCCCRVCKLPPGLRDSWCGILGKEELNLDELGTGGEELNLEVGSDGGDG